MSTFEVNESFRSGRKTIKARLTERGGVMERMMRRNHVSKTTQLKADSTEVA